MQEQHASTFALVHVDLEIIVEIFIWKYAKNGLQKEAVLI